MSNYKECEVIILPTQYSKESYIPLFKLNKNSHLRLFTGFAHTVSEFFQFYIVSNEEIKEKDWVYEKNLNQEVHIYQVYKRNNALCFFRFRNVPIWLDKNPNNAKKIIASTDPVLTKQDDEYTQTKNLPQIPQSFISLYIEEYNKGNIITKINVEYEPCGVDSAYRQYYSLKINQDNTISIKPLKDSWNKGEVIDKLLQFRKDILNGNLLLNLKDKDNLNTFNDWIKKNL